MTALLFAAESCGGGSSTPSNTTSGPLAGNWQFFMVQGEPRPQSSFGASGFIQQNSDSLTGNIAFPATQNTVNPNCGGVATMTGTVSGSAVQLSFDVGGSSLTFTGTLAGDNKSMTGSYQGPGGGCFTHSTSGTWTALIVPSLNGTFTGELTNSTYMEALNGITPSTPISITGSLVELQTTGASNATLSGTINAVGYPCFSSATVSGTISGENVYLTVFGYNGLAIGTFGAANSAPAIASAGANGAILNGTLRLESQTGSTLTGPCPPVTSGTVSGVTYDQPQASLSFGQ